MSKQLAKFLRTHHIGETNSTPRENKTHEGFVRNLQGPRRSKVHQGGRNNSPGRASPDLLQGGVT